MSENRAEDLTKSADPTSGEPEPGAANQHKTEPVKSSPEGPAGQVDEDTDAPVADRNGVPVPDTNAAGGLSEQGVESPAIAAPGKPDGEVDTRA